MKKLLLSVVALLAAITVSARDLQYKLVRYSDDYGYETTEFIYDAQHKMIATHTVVDDIEGYEFYDSIRYDDNGNLVKISEWQLINNEFKLVNYVDYTYDAQNRITSRSNYNLIGGTFELGGIYTYIYDEAGNHTLTYLDMGGVRYQQIEYTYEEGKLVEEIWKNTEDPFYGGQMLISEKITYDYNIEGKLTAKYDSMYEANAYTLYKRHEYSYDKDGNCESHKSFDGSANETERRVYTYCDKLKEETLMPYTPEMTRPEDTEYNVNVYTKEEYWALDANWHLQHICDYNYEYVGINESGVEDVNDNVIRKAMAVKKILIDGRLYIECGDKMYDLNGRRVK
ncbi:MAG: hypothetical protein MJ002_00180 [Paludibacteraceae bacterium]|nr:hypothetical protein [Paludibacteraceae bacterium]